MAALDRRVAVAVYCVVWDMGWELGIGVPEISAMDGV